MNEKYGVEIDNVLRPFNNIPCVAATEEDVAKENALILAAASAGETIE